MIIFAAVKKGRYSLDRRAEAILESRQYWGKNETPKSEHIKEETGERNNSSDDNSSVTSPSFNSRGSSVSSQSGRSQSDSTLSPQPVLTAGDADLSTDDIFTMLSEVYGDEMIGGGGASYDNSSTLDTASLSTLLSPPTMTPNNIAQDNITTTATAVNNVHPESQFNSNYTNISPLEQFNFNAACSQASRLAPFQNPTDIGPHLLSKSEIKQELPPTPSPSSSGNGVSPGSYSPASAHEIAPPSSEYPPGATATFGLQMPGASGFPAARTVPVQQTPPVQPV